MSIKGKSNRFVLDPQYMKDTEEKYGNIVDLSDMPDDMRMSAKLIAIAEPFHESGLGFTVLYDCATIAWNECLQEDHNKVTDYLLHNMLLNFANYRGMIDMLKKRKRLLFPDDIRSIKEVTIMNMGNDSIHINVVSDMDMEFMVKAALKRLEK